MIRRLGVYMLDRLGVPSPSLYALGVRPSLRWVLGGKPEPMPAPVVTLTDEQVARILARGRETFDDD